MAACRHVRWSGRADVQSRIGGCSSRSVRISNMTLAALYPSPPCRCLRSGRQECVCRRCSTGAIGSNVVCVCQGGSPRPCDAPTPGSRGRARFGTDAATTTPPPPPSCSFAKPACICRHPCSGHYVLLLLARSAAPPPQPIALRLPSTAPVNVGPSPVTGG